MARKPTTKPYGECMTDEQRAKRARYVIIPRLIKGEGQHAIAAGERTSRSTIARIKAGHLHLDVAKELGLAVSGGSRGGTWAGTAGAGRKAPAKKAKAKAKAEAKAAKKGDADPPNLPFTQKTGSSRATMPIPGNGKGKGKGKGKAGRKANRLRDRR